MKIIVFLSLILLCLSMSQKTSGIEPEGWQKMYIEYWHSKYPETVGDREGYIREYLSYTDLRNEEIENLIGISKLESSAHDPLIEPKTFVKHCQRANGGYYAVELSECNSGDKVVHLERSIGVFQILPSTYKSYKCEGDIKNIDNQLNCAVKIYKKSGYKAWYNSAKKLNLL